MKLKTIIPKLEARKFVLDRCRDLSTEEARRKSNQIIERLALTDDYKYARTVHCYVNTRPCEVETRRLIDLMEGGGKAVVLPKLNTISKNLQRFYFTGWENLVKNDAGFYEPKAAIDEDNNDIDLFIVPAIAVSALGQRVGSGGSYYDKMLRKVYSTKIVLAYEFQIFDAIEMREHDVRIDKIITERRIIDTRNI